MIDDLDFNYTVCGDRTATRRLIGDAHRRTFAERQVMKEQKPSEMKRVRARTSIRPRKCWALQTWCKHSDRLFPTL